eukprot:Tamp_07470.p1 GENE.Tamp_07470~~Tamp_07470.p1  ORF type:complete len:751 (-),score=117.76 Tamp_07470:241-2352(-)
MAFSPAGATRMSPVPVQADSRVCSLCAASRWRRRAGVENVWLHRRQRMLVPRMNEQQEDARDAINDRMASEFERVSFELSQMGVLGDDDYQVATRVSDGPSSFTADELVALQSLLGQDAAPEQQCVEEGEMWPHGKTLSCGGEAYSSTDGHSAVVAGDGRLFTWGSGGSGRLGRQSADAEAVPAAVGGLLDDVRRQAVRVRAVSCGFDHSACVTDDGRVFVWGSGGRGQLGLGSLQPQLAPAEIRGVLAAEQVTEVSCGRCHTGVLTGRGKLFTFGQGDDGQLGHGSDKDLYEPCEVGGVLAGEYVSAVSCGAELSACVTDTGALYTWGSGIFGQLGLGDTESRLSPSLVSGALQGRHMTAVSCGIFHVLALDRTGTVFSWGDGTGGQLGHGDEKDQMEAQQVAGALGGCRVARISAGSDYSACVTDDGRLFTWGSGGKGKLGHGGTDDELWPRLVGGALAHKEVVDVACASEHTMCITRDGKVYVWGRGGGGQLGLGDTEDRMEPVEVTGLVAATRMRSSLLPPTVNRAAAASGTAETKAQEPGNQQARRRGEVLVTGSGGGGSRALDGSAGSRGADALQAGTAGEKVEYKLVDGVIETLRPSAAVDDVLEKHEARWMAIAGDDASYPSAVSYLLHRINVDRDLSPILEPQGLRELAYAIYRYRNKMVEPDAQDLKYFADQTGLAGSDAERWRSSNRSKWNK